jgi:hypothetical protein
LAGVDRSATHAPANGSSLEKRSEPLAAAGFCALGPWPIALSSSCAGGLYGVSGQVSIQSGVLRGRAEPGGRVGSFQPTGRRALAC